MEQAGGWVRALLCPRPAWMRRQRPTAMTAVAGAQRRRPCWSCDHNPFTSKNGKCKRKREVRGTRTGSRSLSLRVDFS
eukprot:scaffold14939_cov115-Isochrysis_galbana.AAC.2